MLVKPEVVTQALSLTLLSVGIVAVPMLTAHYLVRRARGLPRVRRVQRDWGSDYVRDDVRFLAYQYRHDPSSLICPRGCGESVEVVGFHDPAEW